jgi:hypothetical protein
MTTELYIIAVSAVILTTLISIRYFKVAYARSDTSPRFLESSDDKVKDVTLHLQRTCLKISDGVSGFIKSIPHRLLHLIHIFLNFLSKKTKRWVDLVKGKNIQTNKGAVSLYLRQLEDKNK